MFGEKLNKKKTKKKRLRFGKIRREYTLSENVKMRLKEKSMVSKSAIKLNDNVKFVFAERD